MCQGFFGNTNSLLVFSLKQIFTKYHFTHLDEMVLLFCVIPKIDMSAYFKDNSEQIVHY
jgi:hypothetical protein